MLVLALVLAEAPSAVAAGGVGAALEVFAVDFFPPEACDAAHTCSDGNIPGILSSLPLANEKLQETRNVAEKQISHKPRWVIKRKTSQTINQWREAGILHRVTVDDLASRVGVLCWLRRIVLSPATLTPPQPDRDRAGKQTEPVTR